MKTFQTIATKIGAIIIFFFILSSVSAQSTWKHIRENPVSDGNSSFLIYVDCTQDLNNNSYCVGLNITDNFEDNLLMDNILVSLDDKGNITNEYTNVANEYAFVHIAQIPDTETFYTLSFNFIDRSWLTTVWDYDLTKISEEIVQTGANEDIYDFVFTHTKLKNGNLLFLTNGEDGSDDYALFTEVNPNGKVVNTYITYIDFCASVVENPNGSGYYCIGDGVIELDNNFEVLQDLGLVDVVSEYNYGTTGINLDDKILLNYISVEYYPELTLFDKDMKIIKSVKKDSSTDVGGFLFNSMIVSENKEIYTAHQIFQEEFDFSKSNIVLTKYDANLNEIWETIIEDSINSYQGIQLTLANDGGIIISGLIELLSIENDISNAFVFKLDGNGMLSSTNELKPSLVATTVYPNPSSGPLNIAVQNITENCVLQLTNATGTDVAQKTILNNELNNLDFSSLPNGVYYYQVLSNNKKISSGKWIKMQ